MIVLSGKVKGIINRIRFSDDANALAASVWSDGFQVWEQLGPCARPRLFDKVTGTDQFAFLPQSKQIYVLGYHRLFHIDLETGRCDQLHRSRRIDEFAISPDGRYMLLADGRNLSCRTTKARHPLVWERRDVYWGAQIQFLPSGESVLGMISRDFLQRRHSLFAIHAFDSGQEVYRSNVLPGYSKETIVSPDESFMAYLTGRCIRIYPLRGQFREPLTTLQNDVNRQEFTGIAFHPSGKYLAATSNDRTVKLFDTTNWEVIRTFTWDIGRMRSVCFSPDGRLAAAGGSSGKVVVWDVDF